MSIYWRGGRARDGTGTWCMRYTDASGKLQRVATPYTKRSQRRDAELLYAEVIAREARRKVGLEPMELNPKGFTLAKAAQWWLDGPGKDLKSHARDKTTVRKHLIDDPIGALRLERVSRGELNAWMSRKRLEYSAQTVKHLIMYVQRVFSELEKVDAWFGRNPAKAVEAPTVQAKAREHIADPTHAKRLLWALRGEAHGQWETMTAVALYAGLRRGEVLKLLGHHVSFERRLLAVVDTKSGVDRYVPIHDDLLPLLKRYEVGPWEAYFESPRGRGALRSECTKASRTIRAACKRAGIPEVTFHGLRHSWATRAAECGVNAEVLEAIGWGGKKGSTRRDVYTHYSAEYLVSEINKLSWPEPELDLADGKVARITPEVRAGRPWRGPDAQVIPIGQSRSGAQIRHAGRLSHPDHPPGGAS
jgi:integrase